MRERDIAKYVKMSEGFENNSYVHKIKLRNQPCSQIIARNYKTELEIFKKKNIKIYKRKGN